jgi:glucose-1-phosphate thymidylyltransferase
VPVAGFGTRLRPHTYTLPKALMPVAGKPILGHILDELLEIGVDEVVLVVGHLGEKIEAYVRENYEVPVHFVRQERPLGNGHAIYVAREYLEDEAVLIMLGDTIFRGDFRPMLRSPVSLIGVREVPDPRRFGVVEVDDHGRVLRVVEKPEHPPSNLAITGVYFIHDTPLFRRCLERLIHEDRRVRGSTGWRTPCSCTWTRGRSSAPTRWRSGTTAGRRRRVLAANRALLDLLDPPAPRLEGALVHPPVAIAPTAVIEESVVGPHVSVAEGARVVRSVIRDCIVNRNATVRHVVLQGSLIGEGCVFGRTAHPGQPGDDSEIELGG